MSKDLIDRAQVKESMLKYGFHAPDMTVTEFVEDELTTIDAVPVVRCRNCKYHSGRIPGQPNIICFQMHEDDFCSYGEPKEDTKRTGCHYRNRRRR